MELYVYNPDLDLIGVIDEYTSLIWAKRYQDIGDCEVQVPANTEYFDYLKIGNYIQRSDDDMICQIKKIELDTDAENGNYIIATGYDAKRLLDQRIVLFTKTANGSAETFARSLVSESLGVSADTSRQIQDSHGNVIFDLGTAAGLPEVLSEQVTYKNVGEKIREYCTRFGWGYRVILDSGVLKFELYKGEDKTSTVVFSDEYENLATTVYTVDDTHMGNYALVAGEGEGSARSKAAALDVQTSGVNRYEIYVDARDVSKTITFEDLKNLYGATGYILDGGSKYYYMVPSLDVQIIDSNHLAWLEQYDPNGTVVTVSGIEYYRMENVVVAELETAEPEDSDDTTLQDVVYLPYLYSRGHDNLSEYGAVTSYEGTVEPNVTFDYKIDYDLGDLVTVRNEYNITAQVRIVEVIEVYDNNGYSCEPKFEYINREGSV